MAIYKERVKTMKENSIIIDGVKHIPIRGNYTLCGRCSLQRECSDMSMGVCNDLCNLLFGTLKDGFVSHFEILKQE